MAIQQNHPPTRSLAWRRTLIPPCLVVGLFFMGSAAAYYLQPSGGSLRSLSRSVAVFAGITGVLLLGMGVFNMIFVKKATERQKTATIPPHGQRFDTPRLHS